MNTKLADQLWQAAQREMERKRSHRHLAQRLAHRLEVVQGNHLVALLAPGSDARTNGEAILYWIERSGVTVQGLRQRGENAEQWFERALIKTLQDRQQWWSG
ncbi:hypothetical protein [Aestuariirhabdus sp. LZHN29]|uniref:hypothetical protein n=1 Tax=Aestuariirhabdus sp. LZHN29 TaxID=3417462 RepID=UPI003CFB4CD3